MPKKSDAPTIHIAQSYEDTQESKYIVYGYFRKRNDSAVYIGVDSNGHVNRRYNNHSAPGRSKEQNFNALIQKSQKIADELEYRVLAICESKEEMENLETMYILFYKAFGQCEFNKAVSMSRAVFEEFVKNLEDIDVKFSGGID